MFAYCGNSPVANKDSNEKIVDHSPIMVNDGYNYYIPPQNATTIVPENNSRTKNYQQGQQFNLSTKTTDVRFIGAAANASSSLLYLTGKYSELYGQTRGTGLQVHHLLEQRFYEEILKNKIYTQKSDMLCVVLDKDTHQSITNQWRALVPYGSDYSSIGFESIQYFAIEIYGDTHPDWISALFD